MRAKATSYPATGPDGAGRPAAAAGIGVGDLAGLLAGVPYPPEPGGVVIARSQAVAGGLDRFAEVCGDPALIADARALAAAVRRDGRDFTTVLTRLGGASRAETRTHTTTSPPMPSGRSR